METLNYNITREDASELLGISTRTLDRYIKRGKISYKKIANRVYLASSELDFLNKEESHIHQNHQSELIGNIENSNKSTSLSAKVEEFFQENIDRFFHSLKEKDKQLEEKNKLIFAMQHKIGELEAKLQTAIALPDYTKEKEEIEKKFQEENQKLKLEKEKIEIEKTEIEKDLKGEKIRNISYLIMALILAIVCAGLLYIKFRK